VTGAGDRLTTLGAGVTAGERPHERRGREWPSGEPNNRDRAH